MKGTRLLDEMEEMDLNIEDDFSFSTNASKRKMLVFIQCFELRYLSNIPSAFLALDTI